MQRINRPAVLLIMLALSMPAMAVEGHAAGLLADWAQPARFTPAAAVAAVPVTPAAACSTCPAPTVAARPVAVPTFATSNTTFRPGLFGGLFRPFFYRGYRPLFNPAVQPVAVTAARPVAVTAARPVLAARACNTCQPTVAMSPVATPAVSCGQSCTTNFVPQTTLRPVTVNVPVTTYRAVITGSPCSACAQTVLQPVQTMTQQVRYVPTTTMRPVTSCRPACGVQANLAPACPSGCGVASPACPGGNCGVPATMTMPGTMGGSSSRNGGAAGGGIPQPSLQQRPSTSDGGQPQTFRQNPTQGQPTEAQRPQAQQGDSPEQGQLQGQRQLQQPQQPPAGQQPQQQEMPQPQFPGGDYYDPPGGSSSRNGNSSYSAPPRLLNPQDRTTQGSGGRPRGRAISSAFLRSAAARGRWPREVRRTSSAGHRAGAGSRRERNHEQPRERERSDERKRR